MEYRNSSQAHNSIADHRRATCLPIDNSGAGVAVAAVWLGVVEESAAEAARIAGGPNGDDYCC